MASLKECRARARKLGLTVIKISEKSKASRKYRYRFNHWYCKDVEDLSKSLTIAARQAKKSEMMQKLNGHRPKYGYKTVPRRRR